MTFLNPAILFGLLAASIPVVLHFLNLRKLRKIEFSTLAFLKELQKTKIRRIKLKQWLLLLLRVLIITFLVFAFARPAFKGRVIGSASSARTTAVFIIDNSFSMSVIGSGGSNFNKIKQAAIELLNNFQPGDEISILPLSFRKETGYNPKSDLSIINREISDLNISGYTNKFHDSFIKAGQILYESKNINKEIYFLSDLQQGMLFTSRNELEDLGRLFNNVQIFILGLTDNKPINLGIDDFKIENQIFETNMNIRFTAKVNNYSSSPVNNSVASLFINGKRSAQQSIALFPNESTEIKFETVLTDTDLVEAWVELEDDDIIYDNKRFLNFYIPTKIDLLILTDVTEDALFPKLALATAGNKYNITEANLSRLTTINLDRYDAVLIIGSEGNSNWEQLKSFVDAGGGLIIMPGSKSTISSLQNLIGNFSASIPTSFIGNVNTEGPIFGIEKVDLLHPLFAELFEDKSKTNIESPDINYHIRIPISAKEKSIITMDDRSSFLTEYKFGSGNILIFNSAPIMSWNNFPMKSFFAPLINKSILYVSSIINEQNNLLAGEEISVKLNPSLSKQIKVIRPDNTVEYFNTDSLVNRNYMNYINTELFGIYKFYSSDKLFYHASVNHNPQESVSVYYEESAIKDYFNSINYNSSPVFLSEGTNISRVVNESRFGSELWKYFLIVALLLALIEMLISKSSRKDISELKT